MEIFEVNPTELILKTAEELKKEEFVQPPEWSIYVKTGHNRERHPTQDDWWHIRAAAILRRIQIAGPIGTQKLRRQYGGRKNRGMKPDRFYVGSGNIIRTILQQLEKAGLAKQEEKEVHKGRVLTPKGHKLLSTVSAQIYKENKPEPIELGKAAEEKPVKKSKETEEKPTKAETKETEKNEDNKAEEKKAKAKKPEAKKE